MNYGMKSHLISARNLRRVMKAEDGDHGGSSPTPTQPGDNTSGNQGGQSGDSTGADNTGQAPDYSQFWRDPSERDSSTSASGGSADEGNRSEGSPNQQQQQEQNPALNLAENISKIDFGANVMTESAVKKLAEGDASEFHQNLNQMSRDVVTATIRTIIPIMSQLRDQMRTEIEGKVTTTNTNRDNEAALLAAIPSAKDPKVRPIVDNIYTQALKVTNNDRAKAISMTKDMLKLTATQMSDDIGLPPPSSGDTHGFTNSKTDWLEELAGR